MFLIVLFLFATSLFSQTVTAIRIPSASLSHGSAQVLFDTSATLSPTNCGAQFTPGAACWRLRLKSSSCSAGTGGTVYTPDYHAVASLQYSMAMNLTGLTPSTTYYVCPEVSNDGSTWSTGIEQTFTTSAIPSPHPALPTAPAAFTIPATPAIGAGACGSGSGTCAVAANDCSNGSTGLQARLNTAVAGDTITIPSGTVCNGNYTLPTASDAVSFTGVDATNGKIITSTSTFQKTAHGLADQAAVRLASSICLPGTVIPKDPNGSGSFNCNNTGGLLPGYLYYVKKTDNNNFQLSLTAGGTAINFGYVQVVADASADTLTIQPGPYEQAYAKWSTSGNATLGTDVAFQLNTSTTLPGGLSADTNYYLLTDCSNTIKCASQVSLTQGGAAVNITSTGTGTHYITTVGVGTHYVLVDPSASGAYVTIRTPASATITPEGVRTDTSYQAGMATIRQDAYYAANTYSLTTGILSHNYRFINIEFTTNTIGSTDILYTVDPRPFGNLMSLGQDSGNIIFDRCYIHGKGYPDRFGKVAIFWNGYNTAFVNSYFDKMDYWQPWITGFTPSTSGATNVTLATGSGYGSTAFHPVTTSTTIITITGGSASGTGYIYIDIADGIMKVRVPTGITGTCVVTGLTCSLSAVADTTIPTTNGRILGLKIASFTLVSGSVTAVAALDPYGASESTEGSQAIIAGVGPGPYNFTNNYVSGTGIPLHFDDGGNHYALRADYTIKRNYFNTPKTQQQGHSTSDHLRYGHRQSLEFKGGKRILIDGNEFVGGFMESTRTSRIAPELTVRNGGTTTDIKISNNSVHDSVGGFSMIGAIDGLPPISYPMLRYYLYNNLLYNIDGGVTNQATVQQGTDGVAWATNGGFGAEDIVMEHNTFYNQTGSKPSFIDYAWNSLEGFSAKNNIFWVGTGTTGVTFAGSEEPPGCTGLTGKAALDCVMLPSYTFSGNAIIPAGNNVEATLETAYSGLSSASLIPANGATIGWWSTSLYNFRFKDSGLFNSAAKLGTDNLDIGANIDALEDAMGLIKNIRPLSTATTSFSVAFHAPEITTSCWIGYGTSSDPTTWGVTSSDTTASKERTIALSSLTTKSTYYYRVWCNGVSPSATQITRTY